MTLGNVWKQERMSPPVKLLTIAVPSYNAEGTLGRTLDSLCASQKLDALDVVVVNDGSADGTLALARGYERRCPSSVRVIDKPNGGHGSGINAGLSAAEGKYFGVVDADDWVDAAALDEVLERLDAVEDDLILNEMTLENLVTGQSKPSAYTEGLERDTSYPLAQVAARAADPFHMCTLLARTQMLREVPVNVAEHVFYADGQYVVQLLSTARTVYCSGRNVYHYLYNNVEQSVSESSYLRNREHLKTILLGNFAFRASRRFAPENLACIDALMVEQLRQYVYICRMLMPDRASGRREAAQMLAQTPPDMRVGGSYRVKLALYAVMNRLGMGARELYALKRRLGKADDFWGA